MDHSRVIAKLKQDYPDKKIIKLPEGNPTEILCEVDPPEDHPNYSIAISVIDRSAPHYHHHMTEVYEVLTGKLSVFINGVEHQLGEGDQLTIPPGTTHYAIGNETWIKCTAKPGWTLEDHILEDTKHKRVDN